VKERGWFDGVRGETLFVDRRKGQKVIFTEKRKKKKAKKGNCCEHTDGSRFIKREQGTAGSEKKKKLLS